MHGQLGIGQSVELVVEGDDGAEPLRAFVYGLPAAEILLTFPGTKQPPPELVIGASVSIRFWSGLGAHHATSTVLRVAAGTTATAAIVRVARWETIQRRRFFRVAASLPVSLAVRHSMVADSSGKEDRQALSIDLSAGGARIESSLLLTVDDRVRVAFATPRALQRLFAATLEVDGRVVRVEEATRRSQRPYSVGVDFLFDAERERDRFAQLTFELQRGLKP